MFLTYKDLESLTLWKFKEATLSSFYLLFIRQKATPFNSLFKFLYKNLFFSLWLLSHDFLGGFTSVL